MFEKNNVTIALNDKTTGKTNEDIKNTECTLKSATEKEKIEQIESNQDKWGVHQAFTPTKVIQKIQYLETQTSSLTRRDKLKRKWKRITN